MAEFIRVKEYFLKLGKNLNSLDALAGYNVKLWSPNSQVRSLQYTPFATGTITLKPNCTPVFFVFLMCCIFLIKQNLISQTILTVSSNL